MVCERTGSNLVYMGAEVKFVVYLLAGVTFCVFRLGSHIAVWEAGVTFCSLRGWDQILLCIFRTGVILWCIWLVGVIFCVFGGWDHILLNIWGWGHILLYLGLGSYCVYLGAVATFWCVFGLGSYFVVIWRAGVTFWCVFEAGSYFVVI